MQDEFDTEASFLLIPIPSDSTYSNSLNGMLDYLENDNYQLPVGREGARHLKQLKAQKYLPTFNAKASWIILSVEPTTRENFHCGIWPCEKMLCRPSKWKKLQAVLG